MRVLAPLPLLLTALIAGCSSGPVIIRETGPDTLPMPLPRPRPVPGPEAPPVPLPAPAPAPAPAPSPVPLPAPLPPPPAPPPPVHMPSPAPVSAAEVRALALRLLPNTVSDRRLWADDIATSFAALGIAAQPHKVCALAAVIEQESTWQADPPVAGLARIAQQEMEKKRAAYGIPKPVFDLALMKTSPNGRTYRQRLDSLRTERELSELYEDMVREIPFGDRVVGQNPVRTGGATQVSIVWAAQQMRDKRYPWQPAGTPRQEVFKRRGAVYFGAAMLLDYPVAYNRMLYRFADYNAGRYASRNAAVQSLLGQLTGQPVVPDGDLLRYRAGEPVPVRSEPSQAWRALSALQAELGLSLAQMEQDMRLEKGPGLAQSPTYRRLQALAERRGLVLEAARLPDIQLKSPKFSRPLTTAWFAERCEARYRTCLARGGTAVEGAAASAAPGPGPLKLVDEGAP